MLGTITQWLNTISEVRHRAALQAVLNPIGDRLSTQTLTSAGLVIKAVGGVLVKAGAAFYAMVQGKLVTKAINTDMAALAGTVANATFNVYAFFIDSAGNLTSAMGTAATTLAGVVFPPIPQGKACIGFVIINPTGTGNFVGNTTALDDVTVVPNAVYVNTIGAFDPTVLIQ
jgi:hypothetical protein